MNRILTLAVVLALSAGGAYAKSCKDPATGKFIKCPAVASSPAAAPMESTAPAKAAPKCKTGKPCGGSCIAASKVCHKM